jgi:hypothetical protein
LRNATNSYDDDTLEVHYVGSYKASIVPNFKSFGLVDTSEFNLAPDTKEILEKYYKSNYGFIVCQLMASRNGDNHKYHPFGYLHEIREDGRLFIPTRHYHKMNEFNPYTKYHLGVDDDNQDVSDHFMSTLSMEDKWLRLNIKKREFSTPKKKPIADWDHEVYVINCSRVRRNPLFSNKIGATVLQADSDTRGYLKLNKLPENFVFGNISNVTKLIIDSSYKYNCDFIV